MALDGRPDSQRNQYNVAGVQVANPQAKGDISVGGPNVDPTGRTIAVTLSATDVPNGYVLTRQEAAPAGVAWSPAAADVSGTPTALAVFDADGSISSSELVSTPSAVQVLVQSTISTPPNLMLRDAQDYALQLALSSLPGDNGTAIRALQTGVTTQTRLTVNESLTAQRMSLYAGVIPQSGIYVRGIGANALNNNKTLSRHAIAHFDTGTNKTAVGQVTVLPTLTAVQRDALIAEIQNEYNLLKSALPNAVAVRPGPTGHILSLINNGIFYCEADDSYYVLTMDSANPRVSRILTEDNVPTHTLVQESSVSILLAGRQTADVNVTNLFNFGQVLKVACTPSPTATFQNPAQLQVTFYSAPGRSANDFIESLDVIASPTQTSTVYPSITVDDTLNNETAYLRVSNLSQEAVSVTLLLKGYGAP